MVRQSASATIWACRVRLRGAALRGTTGLGIGVSVAYATRTHRSPLGDTQFPLASLLTFHRIPLLFALRFNVGVAGNIVSKRLEDFIRERDNLSHTLSNIKEHFQKTEYELRVVKNEKVSLKLKDAYLHAELEEARAERQSLQGSP